MAVLCPLPEVHQSIQSYSDTWIHVLMATSEISEDPATQFVEDRMYVAVGKDLKESKLTLTWALHNSGGRKICILHVHQPAQRIPFMGTKVLVSQLDEGQVRAYRETERQEMDELLRNYNMIFNKAGVHADTVHIEMDSVEKGIVELISQHGIRKLVMGAAADKQYSKKMMEPKSKKAIYIRQQAPTFCHIWFICKGKLVHTREGRLDGSIMEVASPVLPASPNTGSAPSSSLRSPSVIEGRNDSLRRTYSGPGFHSVRSEILGIEHVNSSPNSSEGVHTRSRLSSDGTLNDWNDFPRRSLSVNSCWSSCASSDIIDGSPLILNAGPVAGFDSPDLQQFKELHLSPPVVLEGGLNDELYDQLERAMADADNSRREAFEESMRRRKAEKDAFDSSRRAKTSETLYTEELRRRKETEEALARGQEEVEKMKIQLDEVMEELCVAQEQKASLEGQIADSDQMVQDLEHKMFSAIELLQKYKYERDELEVERDDALKVAKDLRRNQAEEASSTLSPHFFSGFSFSEIKEATNSFDPSLKIGEGGYGSIYKGILRHTQVAIKVPHSHSSQGPSEFEQEVNILSKLRHPNLVTLIGACPEAWILVYEYLPNGSLEDRLSCKDNTPPLTWQTRIRIAAELCSVLIFLHSCNPGSIVHGDVKPANILLDANYVSKLGDFGICRVLTRGVYSSGDTTLCHRTDPKGTIAYMDPDFFATSDLTAKSDVYSFGIILLRLLTGRSALGIVKEVKCALNNGNLKDLLDPTAGDWPFVQARQLAHLAIRCSEMNRKNRPDLVSEVSKVLGPMRVSCGASSSRMSSEEHYQIPHYFICPIFQEIMQDPHVAADGYTYELEALRGWLDSGNDTSPMTNLQLPHHNLVPNRALRSAIQEWKQRR